MSESAIIEPVANGDSATETRCARILLDGVTKRYSPKAAPAVDNITMEIRAGEIVMLVGPSGCGKTTTMKMINRLIEPTSGRILIGDDAHALDEAVRANPEGAYDGLSLGELTN